MTKEELRTDILKDFEYKYWSIKPAVIYVEAKIRYLDAASRELVNKDVTDLRIAECLKMSKHWNQELKRMQSES